MRSPLRRLHLRIPHPHWPSRDYRDYQTATATGVDRADGAELPRLIRVLSIHREQALLHVELLGHHVALDRRLAVRLPEGSGEPCGLSKLRTSPRPEAGRAWTVTLTLN